MERDQEIQRKITQALLVTKIKNLGVNKIEITFSGSGDSGDIDEVQFIANEWDDITPDITSKIGDDCINHFRDVAYNIIEDKVDPIGDWVNNEGGFGTIIISTDSSSYDLNYSQRITEDHDWSDEMMFI
jgi:hypothetical protein